MIALLLSLWLQEAHAGLAGPAAGVQVDLGAGLGVGDLPWTPGVGWTLAVGGWWGRYDEEGALGRHVAVLARVRQDLQQGELRTYPGLEVRRGIDLLVVGLRFGGFVAPVLHTRLAGDLLLAPRPGAPFAPPEPTALTGVTARALGAVAWRFRPPAALVLRLEAGVDVDARSGAPQPVEPALGVLLGFEFSPRVRTKAR